MPTSPKTALDLSINWRGASPPTKAWLLGRLQGVLREVGVRSGLWHLLVVRDSRMRALHRLNLRVSTTTDVLTFDLRDEITPRRTSDREGSAVELDTVICVDEARRRAGELGHLVREEVLLYALHSLLHVQGYDDATAAQAKRMHRREDEILLRLGVGAVYAGIARAGRSKPGAKHDAAARGKARIRDRRS